MAGNYRTVRSGLVWRGGKTDWPWHRPPSKIHPTHMKRPVLSHVLLLGLVGGVLIAILRWSEYQFLVIEHSLEIYGAIVAIIFVVFGIWLGIKLTKPREKIILREVLVPLHAPTEPAPAVPFTLNQVQL